MSYFELNGHACLDPASVLADCRKKGVDTSSWEGKANSFHHRRGTSPSYGYLLCQNKVLEDFETMRGSSGLGLKVQVEKREKKKKQGKDIIQVTKELHSFPDVHIKSIRKITPAASAPQGFCLAEVCDKRVRLSQVKVGENFNVVRHFLSEIDGITVFKDVVYFGDTVKEEKVEGDSSTESQKLTQVPFTYKDLMKKIFEEIAVVGELHVDIDLFAIPPQDLRWTELSCEDAMEMLLQWTNTTIIYVEEKSTEEEIPSGKYKVVDIKDKDEKEFSKLTEELDYSSICFNSLSDYEQVGRFPPNYYDVHYPLLTPYLQYLYSYSRHTIPYYGISGAPPASKQIKTNGNTLQIYLPYNYAPVKGHIEDFEHLRNDAADKFAVKTLDLYRQFPSQEKTYAPFLSLELSGFVDSISWYDIGDGPKTRLINVKERDWKIIPEERKLPAVEVMRAAENIGLPSNVYGGPFGSTLVSSLGDYVGFAGGATDGWGLLYDQYSFSETIRSDTSSGKTLTHSRALNLTNKFIFKESVCLVLEHRLIIASDSPELVYALLKNPRTADPDDLTLEAFTFKTAWGYKLEGPGYKGTAEETTTLIPPNGTQINSGPLDIFAEVLRKQQEEWKSNGSSDDFSFDIPVAVFAPGKEGGTNVLNFVAFAGGVTVNIDGGTDSPPNPEEGNQDPANNSDPISIGTGIVVEVSPLKVSNVRMIAGEPPANDPQAVTNTLSDPFCINEPILIMRQGKRFWSGFKFGINIISARIPQAVKSSDTAFNFDNPEVIIGTVPEQAKWVGQNSFKQSFRPNETVLLIQRENRAWTPVKVQSQTDRVGVFIGTVAQAEITIQGIHSGVGGEVHLMEKTGTATWTRTTEPILKGEMLSKTVYKGGPLAVIGDIMEVGDAESTFLIKNFFDLSSLPGNDDSTGKIKIVYAKAGEDKYQVASGDCQTQGATQ